MLHDHALAPDHSKPDLLVIMTEKLRLDFRPLHALLGAPGEVGMIDEELAREAIGLLGTAAAMLIEDAHLQLVTTPTDIEEAKALASVLQRLGADLTALGGAAAVMSGAFSPHAR